MGEPQGQTQETVYLPINAQGYKVLVHQGADNWLVQMPEEAKGSRGLPYHRSKRPDDTLKNGAPWGSLVKGIDTGDGWVQTQQRINQETPEVQPQAKLPPKSPQFGGIPAARGEGLVALLLEQGFPEARARAAARRCSSLEAAVDWLMAHPEDQA